MRSLFSLIGFVVVVFLGAGWYFNWYQFNWATGSDGKTDLQLKVDNDKVVGDLKKGVQKGGELIDGLKSKPAAAGDKDFVGPMLPTDTQVKPAARLPVPTRK